MGGDTYVRPVYPAVAASAALPPKGRGRGFARGRFQRHSGGFVCAFSSQADSVFTRTSLHPDLAPKDRRRLCNAATPIVVAVDVTGSMGDWGKVMYDKLPMFFGQLVIQQYCKDPAVSFAGIGDAKSDRAPLQVTRFAKGTDVDIEIAKIWLEGRGGGNREESYDLACYYYWSMVDMPFATSKPFLFITGDGDLYNMVQSQWLRDWVRSDAEDGFDGAEYIGLPELGACLQSRYRVFHLMKPVANRGAKSEGEILKKWNMVVGQGNVLRVEDPKACIDVMLGAIAISQGARGLEEYVRDLIERGQDAERQGMVRRALAGVRAADLGVKGMPTPGPNDSMMATALGLLPSAASTQPTAAGGHTLPAATMGTASSSMSFTMGRASSSTSSSDSAEVPTAEVPTAEEPAGAAKEPSAPAAAPAKGGAALMSVLRARLQDEGLELGDLPRDERELIRNLAELGFHSALDQTRLRKAMARERE